MIFDFLAANADPILAAAGMGFNVVLLPTIWTQWRARASTVSLGTSFCSVGLLAVIIAVFSALHLWIAVGADIGNAALWAVIGWQRIRYGGRA